MSNIGPRLGFVLMAAAALAGCMNGRSSLFATQGGSATNSTNPFPGAPVGSSAPVGPSAALASSGYADPASSRLASAATPVSLRSQAGLASAQAALNLTAPAPLMGSTRVSTRLAANVGPIAAAGRTSLAITPSLAPASSVGASVAAVSQPLNLAATARVGTKAGARTSVAASVKVKTSVVRAALHVAP